MIKRVEFHSYWRQHCTHLQLAPGDYSKQTYKPLSYLQNFKLVNLLLCRLLFYKAECNFLLPARNFISAILVSIILVSSPRCTSLTALWNSHSVIKSLSSFLSRSELISVSLIVPQICQNLITTLVTS